MSTSKTVVTCAEVLLLITMCSAIFLRIGLMGTTVVRSPGANTGAGAAARRTGAAEAAETGEAARAPPPSTTFKMSVLVTRPLIPVPWIPEMSMLCSWAILRTTGEERTRRRSSTELPWPRSEAAFGTSRAPAGAVAGVGGDAAARAPRSLPSPDGAAAAGWAAGVGAGFAAGAGEDGALPTAAAAPASVSMYATTVLIGTVCPSLTLMSTSVPAAGDGISASTLSVEISKIGSSRATFSPGFLSHLVSVPSAMLSPIWGMITSTRMAAPLVRGEPVAGLEHLVLVGQEEILERRGVGHGRVGRRHPKHRAVEMIEGLLVHDGGDLAGDAAGAGVLVHHHHLAGLARAGRDRLAVERQEGAQIDHLRLRAALARQGLGRLETGIEHGAVGHDRQVASLATHRRTADRNDVVLRGQVLLDPAVEELVLEVDDRIVVADGGLDQPLGVVRGRRGHDLETGRVDEVHLRVLRMERAAAHAAAARATHHDGHPGAPAVAVLGGEVGELVEGA